MKKVYKYNTLRGLFRALGNKGKNIRPIFTYSDFLNGRAVLNGWGAAFELSDNLRGKILQMFAGVVWDRGASGKAWKLEKVENVGIFRRLWIEQTDGEYIATYCAGQDYTGEIRFIQKLVNR